MTPDPSPPDGPVPEPLARLEVALALLETTREPDDRFAAYAVCGAAKALVDALKAAAAPSSPLPQLKWEGPNDDGDLLVTLMGVEKMHLTVHGKTIGEALHMLGDVLEGAFMNDCPDPEAHTAPSSPPLAGSASSSTAGVTRFEVITDGVGRSYVQKPCSIELSYQDGGRTLKVFVSPRTTDAPAERQE